MVDRSTAEGAPAEGAPDLPRIDGFVDLVEIGRGGFSIVFAATQVAFDRRVAVKVLNLSGDEARRSEREARALGRLSDLPHIVQAHQVITTTDGRPALVMALMPSSLGRRVKESGPASPADALAWLDQVARALDQAHRLGVYHRDIKPENILLSGWGDAHLADFGIAGVDDLSASTTTALSFSPPHAPPERLMGEEQDLRASDVYSLASTFFTVLTAATPFGTTADGGVYGLTQRVVAEAVPQPPQLPEPVHAVFVRAMAKDPASRYAGAAEFAAALRQAFESTGAVEAAPSTGPWGRSDPPAPQRVAPVVLDGPSVPSLPPPSLQAPATPSPPPFPGPAPQTGPAGSSPATPPRPADDDLTRPHVGTGHTAQPQPRDTPRRPRRRALVAASSLLAIAVVAAAVWWFLRPPAPDTRPDGRLAAGGAFSCALDDERAAWCWGANAGQLGNGNIGSYAVLPARVPALDGLRQVAAGNQHTCAIAADRGVLCWGKNKDGQVGDGTSTDQPSPVALRDLGPARQLAAGRAHTCAVLEDGTVWCWGINTMGQMGLGADDSGQAPAEGSPLPVQVPGISDAVAITAGNAHTCALLADRTVLCWGDDNLGQLGNGGPADVRSVQMEPAPVQGLTRVRALGAGPGHTCALLTGGTVTCWGSNANGELGGGTAATRSDLPVAVPGLRDVTSLAAGGSLTGTPPDYGAAGHTCVVVKDRTVRCWGDNTYGQLGDGTTDDSATPVEVRDLDDVVLVQPGGGPKRREEDNSNLPQAHTCALSGTGTVRCWGDNQYGQLGDGTRTPSRRPVDVELTEQR